MAGPLDISFGSGTRFMTDANVADVAVGFLEQDKFFVVYRSAIVDGYAIAKIGSVSGTDITFGSGATFNITDTRDIHAARLDNNKIVGVCRPWSTNNGTARIGLISDTDIIFGDPEEFVITGDNLPAYNVVAGLSASGFVVAYRDRADSDHGTAKIGTVVGTTIAFGDEAEFMSSGAVADLAIASLDENTFVIAYQDQDDSNCGTIKIGTIDGTNITFGSGYKFETAGTEQIAIDAFSSTKFVVTYRAGSIANAIIGIVDGTTVIFGDKEAFVTSVGAKYSSVAVLDINRFAIGYRDQEDGGRGAMRMASVNGTTIIFGDGTVFNNTPNSTSEVSVDYLGGYKFILGYRDDGDSGYGIAKVGSLPIAFASSDLFTISFGSISASGDLFIPAPEFVSAFGDMFIKVPEPESISSDLFIYGHDILQSSGDMYVYGHETTQVSGSLLIHGHTIISGSTSLFIYGPPPDIYDVTNLYIKVPEPSTVSGNLFIYGYENITTSGDLFIHGLKLASGSIPLFIYSPPPDIYNIITLYIHASGNVELLAKSLDWLLKSDDHNPQIIGTLEGAATVSIQIWDIIDGQNTLIPIISSDCYTIGNTGRWGWSTANLPATQGYARHYFYLMTSNIGETFSGQFIMDIPEGAKWIHPRNRGEYLV